MTGWWRANRWWLAALPLSLAAVVTAGSYHVENFWWDSGLHHERARAEPGHYVTVTDRFDDVYGATSRTFSVRFAGLTNTVVKPSMVGEPDDQPAPPGTQAVQVHLDWRADPDQVLLGCTLTLLDDQGRRYETSDFSLQYPCVPDQAPGPSAAATKNHPRGYVEPDEDRPRAWSTAPVVLLPDGVTITEVRVWWELPDYVSLPAPES